MPARENGIPDTTSDLHSTVVPLDKNPLADVLLAHTVTGSHCPRVGTRMNSVYPPIIAEAQRMVS